MKKLAISILLVISLLAIPAQGMADSSLKIIFEDTVWGLCIGALVGTATLAFVDHPSDHLDRIAQGASVGVIGGMCFGLYEISPVFYSIKDPVHKDRVYVVGLRIPFK
ncbi:MAG: hypothetical protein U9P49_01070 [Thermodesulfobacteriota bacterium]|nr:hypothetical protein [Thermodesulfobacteriota bacterium]